MEKQKTQSPPTKEKKLTLNVRAWEYFTMLDDHDAWEVFKAILESFFRWDDTKIEKILDESYWTQKKMILMMRNEHLFDD